MDLLEAIRLFFGGIFILFVPRFAWSFVLLNKRESDWLERIAISVGLLIALVPLTVFWLNFLFRVEVSLLNTNLIVCGMTVIPAVYIIIKRSSWGKNTTGRPKSALGRGRGKRSL